jgi:hypothetical protein
MLQRLCRRTTGNLPFAAKARRFASLSMVEVFAKGVSPMRLLVVVNVVVV